MILFLTILAGLGWVCFAFSFVAGTIVTGRERLLREELAEVYRRANPSMGKDSPDLAGAYIERVPVPKGIAARLTDEDGAS